MDLTENVFTIVLEILIPQRSNIFNIAFSHGLSEVTTENRLQVVKDVFPDIFRRPCWIPYLCPDMYSSASWLELGRAVYVAGN
jgi:hypothetical protein